MPESIRKLLLGQARDASKCDDIFASSELSAKDTFSLFPWYRTSEALLGQFTRCALVL